MRRHPIGTMAALAIALLRYTGVRKSDVVKLGRQHIHDGWWSFVATKTRKVRAKPHDLPVHSVIAASPTGNLTFLMTKFGKPFTAAGFGNWFRDRCNEAGLPHCTAHGLRKALATNAADNGASDRQLMAMPGWTSESQATAYTKNANRKRLAASGMELIKLTHRQGWSATLIAPKRVAGKRVHDRHMPIPHTASMRPHRPDYSACNGIKSLAASNLSACNGPFLSAIDIDH
jgi:integrase